MDDNEDADDDDDKDDDDARWCALCTFLLFLLAPPGIEPPREREREWLATILGCFERTKQLPYNDVKKEKGGNGKVTQFSQ